MQDAHMLCLAHNLATQRTEALKLPVWRYRFDYVASNLNQYGSIVGAFHGEDRIWHQSAEPLLTAYKARTSALSWAQWGALSWSSYVH
jgi:carboxylesterase type B